MIKTCNVCKQDKEHKSWKSTTCNDCLATGLKWCSSCHEVKDINDFHKNGHTIRSFCKACENTRSIQSKEASGYYSRPAVRESRNMNSRSYKRTMYAFDEGYRAAEILRCHVRRSKDTVTLSAYDWHDTCKAFDFCCAYCGAETKLTVEHVVPVSKGGRTNKSNVIPACRSCNSSKQDKDMIEWYTAQPFYNKSRLENIIKFTKKGGDAE